MSRRTAEKRPPLKVAFRTLTNRNYMLYWTGQLVSLSGTWMQRVAQAWLVLKLTNSPLALGTITTVQFVPIMVFSLFGGVFADRLPRRKLVIATQTVMAIQALIFAVLASTGLIQLWHIYVLAAILGIASAADMPARQAFLMEIVGPENLSNAVALNSTQMNVSRILGPALGGIGIAVFGVAGCFYLNSASYLAVIAALIFMNPKLFFEAAPRIHGNVFKQLFEGLHYALTTADVLFIVIVLAVIGTFGYNFTVMLPLIAKYVLNSGPAGFGVLTSAMGAGAVVSALGVAYMGNPTRKTVLIGGAGFSLLLISLAFARAWAIAIPLTVVLGVFSVAFQATSSTRFQLLAPPAMRGRIMSIYQLLVAGSTPVGSFFFGWMADHLGVSEATFVMGSLCALGIVGGLLFIRARSAVLLPDEQSALEGRRADNRRIAAEAEAATAQAAQAATIAMNAEVEASGGE